jgi:hypothetical protein
VIDNVVLVNLYGEEGKEVLNLLSQSPLAVIPILVNMLTRKEAEVDSTK